MRIRGVPGALAAAALTGAAVVATPSAPASAQPCPDVEVVYARGTSEPPGVGQVGQPFVDTLRAQVPAELVPAPLPPQVAEHVAAVTLFGMPSATWMQNFGEPGCGDRAPLREQNHQPVLPGG